MTKLPYVLDEKFNKVTFEFGDRYPYTFFFLVRGLAGRSHAGTDILCPTGAKLFSPGRIQQSSAYYSPSYGNVIKAGSLDVKGLTFVFAHLSVIPFKRPGKIWQREEVFAWTGSTGFSTQSHLHLETYMNGQRVNPRSYIDFP